MSDTTENGPQARYFRAGADWLTRVTLSVTTENEAPKRGG
jgi:hypothetical protein